MSVDVYTDGSCKGGGSGYAVIYIFDDDPVIEWNCLPQKWNSNQRAELYAIYQALITLRDSEIKSATIYSDSMYSINCLTQWYHNWELNDWKTGKNKPVENIEIIKLALGVLKGLSITFVHVPSHTGNKYNDLADKWAKQGAKKYLEKYRN